MERKNFSPNLNKYMDSWMNVRANKQILILNILNIFMEFTWTAGWRGGYSHSLGTGIYKCVALIGGFVKNFSHMMGALFCMPAPIMGTFFEIVPSLGVKNPFSPL